MAPKKKAQLTISVEAKKLTARERSRLQKAVRIVTSIMDKHDLDKIELDAGVCERHRHHRK
jgi:hypothetical protein